MAVTFTIGEAKAGTGQEALVAVIVSLAVNPLTGTQAEASYRETLLSLLRTVTIPSLGVGSAVVRAEASSNTITAWSIRFVFTSAAVRIAPATKVFLGTSTP
jgi:hypothetical protein